MPLVSALPLDFDGFRIVAASGFCAMLCTSPNLTRWPLPLAPLRNAFGAEPCLRQEPHYYPSKTARTLTSVSLIPQYDKLVNGIRTPGGVARTPTHRRWPRPAILCYASDRCCCSRTSPHSLDSSLAG